jgi:opacity protein-like surface antigen
MKKTIYFTIALSLTAATNTYAAGYLPGPYLGAQAGWGRLDEGGGYQKWADSQPTRKVDLGTFTAWRAFAGYSLIPFFSIEGGYSYFPENNYSSDPTNINVKTYAIDLVGKAIFPLVLLSESLYRVSFYGKAGGVYLNTKTNLTLSTVSKNQSNNSIRPTYGAGITFSLTDNFTLDASWSGVCGKNRVASYTTDAALAAANPTPSSNSFMLGIYYKFMRI